MGEKGAEERPQGWARVFLKRNLKLEAGEQPHGQARTNTDGWRVQVRAEVRGQGRHRRGGDGFPET